MTNEEKQLLVKDLCARLPYRLLIDTTRGAFELDAISRDLISLKDKEGRLSDLLQFTDGKYWFPIVSGNYKPYLRPMSSMTEEEKTYQMKLIRDIKHGANIDKLEDFYHSHYLDYRGLIPMGLALEATEDMYK